ncbi:MAG TPA: hypothetical protein VI756_30890, partial [Blastocatellia bacterium]
AFTGVRPGEKLVEELQSLSECLSKTRHPKIYIGRCTAYPHEQVGRGIMHLAALANSGLDGELRTFLNELVPEAQLGDGPSRPSAGAGAEPHYPSPPSATALTGYPLVYNEFESTDEEHSGGRFWGYRASKNH